MRLFCFQDLREGEIIYNGWINFRRRIDFAHGKNGWLIGVFLPVPIKQTWEDFDSDTMKSGYRYPFMFITWRRANGNGKFCFRSALFMTERR